MPLRTNLQLALRLLVKTPGSSAVAILTLAIAIGVNASIFSLLDQVLFRSGVPQHPEEVVRIYTAHQDARREFRSFSFAEFQNLRTARELFSDVAAVTFNQVSLGPIGALHRAFAFTVSDNYFPLMGTRPAAGRFFTAEETAPHARRHVVVAGYGLWQQVGLRADFVGSSLIVNGRPHTVVGVTPEGFCGISALVAPELWLPLGLFADLAPAFEASRASADLAHPQTYALSLVARLRSGLTPATAAPRLPTLARRLDALQPPDRASPRELLLGRPFSINPQPADLRPLRLMGLLLVALAGVILVIASLNLANMMLARGAARSAEIALRLALGATRRHVVSQLVTEGLVLAAIGGVLGLLLSLWASALLQNYFAAAFATMNFTLTAQLRPNLTVIAATFGFCLLATLIFSLGPALQAARADLVRDLKSSSGDPAVVGRWNRFFSGRHLLVMGQMTLSLVLVFSAGLFARSALKSSRLGPETGFSVERVLLAELDFSLAGTAAPEAARRTHAALERIRTLPGLQSAGLTTLVPYANAITLARVTPAESAPTVPATAGAPRPGIAGLFTAVSGGYFTAIGVPVLRGRDFSDMESRDPVAPRVCIVDEGLAGKLFPGGTALGRRIRYVDAPSSAQPGEMEIVGIVRQHSHGSEDVGRPLPGLYVPLAQAFQPSLFIAARLGGLAAVADAGAPALLRQQLLQQDPALPVLQILPFTTFVGKNFTLWMQQLGAVIFGVFGGIALLLAAIGVYGVKAHAVTRRTREIGIRMALGAGRLEVFSLIMRQGALQTACSVSTGLGLCLLAGQALGAVFFQIDPLDPALLALATAILSAAIFLACYLPARRASKVDPLTALRAE